MFSIKKTFNFYSLSILIGNLLFWLTSAFLNSPIIYLDFKADSILALLGGTYVFSLPLALLSLLFFSIQKTEWSQFINSVSSSIIMALILSIGWATILSHTIFNHESEFALLGPFILAAPIAAVLSELWFDNRQSKI